MLRTDILFPKQQRNKTKKKKKGRIFIRDFHTRQNSSPNYVSGSEYVS